MLLVALDAEKAIPVLTSSGSLQPDHPTLTSTLTELIRLKRPPSEPVLAAILAKNDYQHATTRDQIRGLALQGLAQLKSPSAAGRIDAVLDRDGQVDDSLAVAAWKARFILAERTPLVESAFDAYFRAKCDLVSLTADEKRVCLIGFADSGFSNSGATGWFENLHGGTTGETLEALKHFEATDHWEIFRQIADILAPAGSIADFDERQKLIQDLSDEAGFKLDKLTDKWHKLPKWELAVYHWEWTRLNRSNPPPTP
jgi:hypothetical protein